MWGEYGFHLFVNHKLEKKAHINILSHLPTTTVHTHTLYYPSAGFHCEKTDAHSFYLAFETSKPSKAKTKTHTHANQCMHEGTRGC